MPQPSSPPPPPEAPAPPAPVAPAVGSPALPSTPFVGDPADAQVLAGLRARRELLTQQLEGAVDRRGELANQLTNTSFAEGAIRKGFEQRLQVIDERVVQLERDIVATDRQIAGAPPQLLAETEHAATVQQERDHHDEDDAVAAGFGGFGLGIVALLVAGRVRRWWRRRRGGDAVPAAARDAGPDPRIDRLAHAVDAIAVEVERIGEGQRFVTQLLAESRARVPELAAAGDGPDTQAVPGARR